MDRTTNPNLEILEAAVEKLGPLVNDVVFLGGCATGLLQTDEAAPAVRATQDVDVISELASIIEYHRFAEKLRERGFREDHGPEAVICRWRCGDIWLDVMPTHPEVFGFGNEWYQPALDEAETIELPSGNHIRMVTAPYFLATKLAAFDGRGRGDYLISHDMEDIVAILNGRPEIVDETEQSQPALKQHLSKRFRELLDDSDFTAALPGHLLGDSVNQARLPFVLERIEAIAGM